MSDKKLVSYVKSMLSQGYDSNSIRNSLLKSGYGVNDANNALQEAYSPVVKHIIHISPTTIMAIVLLFIIMLGSIYFIYGRNPRAEQQLLDLNLEPVSTTVNPGEEIVFI